MPAETWTAEQLLNHLTDQGFESLDQIKVTFNNWLERGDGIAVYQNVALDSAGLGHCQYVSFGSPQAQLETDTPPQRLPDIGNSINWRYSLKATYRGEKL